MKISRVLLIVSIITVTGCATTEKARDIYTREMQDLVNYAYSRSVECGDDQDCLAIARRDVDALKQGIQAEYQANLIRDLRSAQYAAAALQSISNTTHANALLYNQINQSNTMQWQQDMINRSNIRNFNDQMQFHRGHMQ